MFLIYANWFKESRNSFFLLIPAKKLQVASLNHKSLNHILKKYSTPPSSKNLFAGSLLWSFRKKTNICSALDGQHCGLGSIKISNKILFKLVLYVLFTMNTFEVFIVALVFLEKINCTLMNGTLSSLMTSTI